MDTRETLQGLVADRYEIVRELGHGGAAVVYLALDLRLGAHVALKILHREFSGSQFASRFAQEIRLMADFHHAHILPVLDSGEWIGRPFYVMSYVEGETLEARLARERRLPLDDVLELARGITSALAYAHAHSVVHRDVKPSNILLSEGHAYLSDFGIAKALKPLPGQHRTTTGTVVGTRAYMSPEQGSHDAELDGRSDLYSLGCVLFEALAGQHPFHSADESRMWAMRFTNAPDSLRRHRESVPARVDAAIMRALARDPADRWQSAREFAEALGVLTLTSEVGIVRALLRAHVR
ncbi:MAG: serine/threonine-protein kinase, partial [Gemmatimonadaceae bacterium]